ncbi:MULTISPECIES: tRNA (N6-threonylcarbamoyladenosine(37)-N6)-methyltransferase TrmO [Halomonas]|uniref:tRNA (N6-threonylcarbamoyladenosine(37)-N6)-methyltransferase TrmO n=1 Tax=Halomonas TaxID=2745 RepID=UPI001C9469DF|nr:MULTISPECIES: tRNA (N6-threonylcarbamoyladenosine(37)-N6)-methyltransferase TrmO [Halomonas]MBY6208405.1 tRNA (N6-threonylcarbamoyladenosine(37)-N6)-methyltransferase TrmO [Halomonas sp. DP3Y7-2]MBY6226876.1 tRNA (N6-threonylcarbamoyladenosine(37)-N6)-methyltransferase TrmO [Halomonas sp. DP3Y7-1]MCA0915377.1 tRNA (N6-threonylcarbamoyladenosine(37)-N6)-methyltransferase TrmO [Halomonas denitrificans]
MSDSSFTLTPIGTIHSDFPDKFGVPRQPGLVKDARAWLTLEGEFADPLAVRGLDEFSHLWLTFIFHLSPQRWKPMVRPPRLGGNARMGVFASRSTHRPNRLGLSLVELLDIDTTAGVSLLLAGADLVDGTPVVDIKPYLPWTESRPDARAGFAPTAPIQHAVSFSSEAQAALDDHPHGASLRRLIVQVLSQDPRPAYRGDDDQRQYGVSLRDVNVRFHVEHEHEKGALRFCVDALERNR